MSTENDSLIGKQLGAYQVQGKLGEGGMALVYKAYHSRLRREVAIKVILSQITDREGFQARFEREAQVIASLEHPNIVSVYDFGEEGNLTYLVMQYVGGGTLREQMRAGRPMTAQQAINYTVQMARALHHAHQRGIVHRDVKPQNMLVSSTNYNHLLLSDFGIAKLYRGGEDPAAISEMPTRSSENDSSLTSVDQIIGTADYMSPEQANGHPVDARTDVYALGVVLYQMLTGEVPFHSTTLRGLLFQHVYTPPPSVQAKNPLIPEILAQIVSKALAKAPGDRFQTAEAMAQALEQANANATNIMESQARSNFGNMASPPSSSYPVTLQDQTLVRQRGQDSYATFTDTRTMPGQSRALSSAHISRPTTDPALTGTTTHKRHLSPSYMIAAGILIVGLLIFGLRFYQAQQPSSTTNQTSNSGVAKAFSEHFQDNSRNWQLASSDQGVTASSPGNGAYKVNISTNATTFPYPQNVGILPGKFTLTATIEQTAGKSDIFYGVAFHFNQGSGGLTCYALAASSNGNFLIMEYKNPNSQPLLIAQGTYQGNPQQTHTFKVQADGNTYAFFIDGKPLSTTIGNNAPSTSWSNSDLSNGVLALLLAGPASSTDPQATYIASNVQLSIP